MRMRRTLSTWYRSLEGGIKKFFDLVSVYLKGPLDIGDTIIVAGSPRSGTTWLLNILSTLRGYKTLFEPLHFKWFPRSEKIGINPDVYLSPDDSNKVYLEYFDRVFRGLEVSNFPHYSFKNLYSRFRSDKLIVKFIRVNRLLPWIYRHFDFRSIYLIIRHPCATISSQISSKIYGYFRSGLDKKLVLKDIKSIPYFKDNIRLIELVENINSFEEVLAAVWCIDYFIPLSFKSNNTSPWYLVPYERLVSNYGEELKNIFKYIGEDVPLKAIEMYDLPTITSYDSKFVGSDMQLYKWRKKLDKEKVVKILKVVHGFGMDFYSDEVEPDYSALRSWVPMV